MASRRAEAAVNIWGPALFPLIANAEVRLSGVRRTEESGSSDSYEISGVVDAIASVKIDEQSSQNPLVQRLLKNKEVRALINGRKLSTYEIIIDYKGMRRPSIARQNKRNRDWVAHELQVLTYAWLRSLQADAAPVVAGVVLYLNELTPSGEDVVDLNKEMAESPIATDIPTSDADLEAIREWQRKRVARPPLILKKRSIRVVPVPQDIASNPRRLRGFDKAVCQIKDSVRKESKGGRITDSWKPVPQPRICANCDFRFYCPKSEKPGLPNVP